MSTVNEYWDQQLSRWRERLTWIDTTLAKCEGKNYMQVLITRKTTPKSWDRVRVLPKAYGRIVGEIRKGVFMVDIKTEQLVPALKVARAEIETFIAEMAS